MMCRSLRAALLLFVALLVPARHATGAGLEVVDLLSTPAHREAARKTLTRTLRSEDVQLYAPDPALLRALQWSIPDPNRTNCEDLTVPDRAPAGRSAKGQKQAPPKPTGPTVNRVLAALLDQVREELITQDLEQGLETLKTARLSLPCSQDIVPKQQVRALFLHDAVSHFFMRDGLDEELFIHAVAVDPDMKFDVGGYPVKVKTAYQKAEKAFAKRSMVQLDEDLEGVDAWLDGRQLEPAEMVAPGRHVLQLRGPQEALRTALVTIPSRGPVKVSELSTMGLFPMAQVRDVLIADLQANRLDPYETKGLEAWLKERGRDAVVFAVDAPGEGKPLFRVFIAGQGLVDLETYLQRSQRVVIKRRARSIRSGPSLGVGLASQLVLGDPAAFEINARYLGVGLRFDQPVGPVLIGARVAAFPYRLRPLTEDGVCGGDGQAACTTAQTGVAFGVGAGYAITFTERLTLVSGLYAEGEYLPELVLPATSGGPGGAVLVDLLAIGPVARARVRYGLLQESIKVDIGLELSGGALFGPRDSGLKVVPLGLTLGAGISF